MQQTHSSARLRIGVLGLGMAGGLMVPVIASHPRTVLAGAADPNPTLRERFARDYRLDVNHDAAELLCRPDIDAVYVATPHQFHKEHVILAARHGKHVIVEKPITLSLADCDAMIEAAAHLGIVLVVGHTHSFDPAIAMMRDFTVRGELGRLAMLAMWNYTDFMYRPRRPEELDTAKGGGIAYNQLPHQVDVARMVSASEVRTVRASMWQLDAARPTEGCCSGFLEFESGAVASMVYSGYDHFDSDELHGWISSSGRRKNPAQGSARRALAALNGQAEEIRLRTERYGYGGGLSAGAATHQPHFGQLILTYEHADVRLSPEGLTVYDNDGVREVRIDPARVGRTAVLDEFCSAVIDGVPAVHDGAFARGTLATCLAILRSSASRSEVAP